MESPYQKTIVVNTPEDIEKLRETCLLARKALDYGHSLVKIGKNKYHQKYKLLQLNLS
jgi:methionine aminopeptidase